MLWGWLFFLVFLLQAYFSEIRKHQRKTFEIFKHKNGIKIVKENAIKTADRHGFFLQAFKTTAKMLWVKEPFIGFCISPLTRVNVDSFIFSLFWSKYISHTENAIITYTKTQNWKLNTSVFTTLVHGRIVLFRFVFINFFVY